MTRAFALKSLILVSGLFLGAQEIERTVWSTSRITGSPDPATPLRAERVFRALAFKKPVELVPFPDHQRYAVVEEDARIWSFRNDPACDKADLLLDLKKEIRSFEKVDGSKGVDFSYALAFDPRFAENRFCYVMYILEPKERYQQLPDGSRVSRFKVTQGDPPRLDPASEDVLITWRSGGHNGCDLQFGNDGYLYISTGDSESPSPPDRLQTGQDVGDLLSSILRIDVHRVEAGKPYGIPSDNPFVGLVGARPEVWCYGLRNPWRMTFDRSTGQLWVGDVGWERWESILCAQRGGNFGWSVMEGPEPCLPGAKRGPTPILPPAHAIRHPEAASIIGGFVYRGKLLKGFQGHYFCGDWETRRVWTLPVRGTTLGDRELAARTSLRIVAFCEDPEGELLLVDHEGGGLYLLVPNDRRGPPTPFPGTLGATGLFASVSEQIPSPGVVEYEIHAPRWADGAVGRRWIGIPSPDPLRQVERGIPGREIVGPRDTVLAKTLSIEGRKLETQILHFDGLFWNGYSYVWNEAQTDATLAPAEGAEIALGRGQTWKVSPRADCLRCHNPWAGNALAITSAQLRHPEALERAGLLAKLPPSRPLVDPQDERATLDARARSYLAVNCAHCHRDGAGGSTRIDLRYDIPPDEMRIHGVRPTLGGFDLTDPYVVCGGDAARSVLLFRIAKLGQGRMPHIDSEVVDEAGVRLLARWIASLPPHSVEALAGRAADQRALETGALDRLLGSTTGALDLVRSWDALPGATRREAVRRALLLPPGLVRELFERFEPPSERRERLGTSPRPERILALHGHAERGRALVSSTLLQCGKCHRFGEGPEKLGPDLSKIGAKYRRAQILEAILEPSKTIDAAFAGVLVQTKGGDVLSGIIVARNDTELVLRDAEKDTRIMTANVRQTVPMKASLMPEGLLQHLTAQEAADLLSYLESLR